jgi:hypothetical protein
VKSASGLVALQSVQVRIGDTATVQLRDAHGGPHSLQWSVWLSCHQNPGATVGNGDSLSSTKGPSPEDQAAAVAKCVPALEPVGHRAPRSTPGRVIPACADGPRTLRLSKCDRAGFDARSAVLGASDHGSQPPFPPAERRGAGSLRRRVVTMLSGRKCRVGCFQPVRFRVYVAVACAPGRRVESTAASL